MTEQEKKAILLLAHIAERVAHENICLKAMLKAFCANPEHLPEWKDWLERMKKDEKLAAPIHEKFRYISAQIEGSADPSKALQALLRDFPVSGKEN